MKIMGIDPGTARLGWGIIKDKKPQPKPLDYGCLTTQKTSSEPVRLKQLYNQFNQLLTKHQPDAVAVENIFFFKNQKTVIQVSQARGVILLTSQLKNLPVFSYSPLEVKMAITGYGRADKNQIQQMTKTILKLDSIPKPDDVADALAVAITHAFSRQLKEKLC